MVQPCTKLVVGRRRVFFESNLKNWSRMLKTLSKELRNDGTDIIIIYPRWPGALLQRSTQSERSNLPLVSWRTVPIEIAQVCNYTCPFDSSLYPLQTSSPIPRRPMREREREREILRFLDIPVHRTFRRFASDISLSVS